MMFRQLFCVFGTMFGETLCSSVWLEQGLVMFKQSCCVFRTVFGDVQSFSIFGDSVW